MLFCLLLLVGIAAIVWKLVWGCDTPKLNGIYSQRGDFYFVKVAILTPILFVIKLIAKYRRLRNVKLERRKNALPAVIAKSTHSADISFSACDKQGNVALIRLKRNHAFEAELVVVLRMADGRMLWQPIACSCLTLDETPSGEEAEDGYISAGGLRIMTLDPVKKYRLVYSGLMTQHFKGCRTSVKVTFRLWFRALTDPADFRIDFSPTWLARSVAVEPNPYSSVSTFFLSDNEHFEQSGELRGIVEISTDDKTITKELSMNGTRDYRTGRRDEASTQGYLELQTRFENGLVMTLRADSFKTDLTHVVSGFVSYPTCFVYPITWTDFHLAQLPENGRFPAQTSVNLSAHGCLFTLDLERLTNESNLPAMNRSLTRGKHLVENVIVVKVSLNKGEQIGFGTVTFNNKAEAVPCRETPSVAKHLASQLSLPPLPSDASPACVALNDPLCRITSLTGGKAARLADVLAVASKHPKDFADLNIPNGIVITAAAYADHLKNKPNLAKLVRKIVHCPSNSSDLQGLCDSLEEQFDNEQLDAGLVVCIEQNLKQVFGKDAWSAVFTAVRSSAVGEDGVDISGAGQMETFLGRKGLQSICDAVKLCWASHFSYRAVKYRRQLGAKLDDSMAVLVQRLVKADVAGVIFTRHPDTGSNAHSVINACYGIGESVVSGSVQPDTISVHNTDANDDSLLEIAYDALGEKANAITLNERDGGLAPRRPVADTKKCCLEEPEIRRLHKVGKLLEKVFGGGRDIEFALIKKAVPGQQIFILQSRPITTADMETDWELTHEFDSPLSNDKCWVTTANVQEMMPGALSPLGSAIWMESISLPMEMHQIKYYIKPRRRFGLYSAFCTFHQHVFFNWTLVCSTVNSDVSKLMGETACFGRGMPVIKIESLIEQNDMSGKFWQILLELISWKGRLMPPRKDVLKMTPEVEGRMPLSSANPAVLLEQIESDLMPLHHRIWIEHIAISLHATVFPIIIMSILDPSLKWSPQLYEDMAMLLSTCPDVYSADVPTLLQEIAASIKADQEALETFIAMERHVAAEWLLSTSSKQHGILFRNFLSKHGHRCVRDSDMREQSWAQQPEKVVDALRSMVSSAATAESLADHRKEALSVAEAVDKIHVPLTNTKKRLIKFFLHKGRVYVGLRETAKSLGIKITDHIRLTIHRIAALLTEKGYIPDEDLIFFFSPEELQIIVKGRSPKLVSKALRRRKFFPKFCDLTFDELVTGHPSPIRPPEATQTKSKFSLSGMAVGSGAIKGTARVVTSLAAANEIQLGEILVVPYTDVGWTPYFPLISGLVTEMGGMISHGAVVAREYGLPCLVGCRRATELIKTGDEVQIDSHKGQIHVLKA